MMLKLQSYTTKLLSLDFSNYIYYRDKIGMWVLMKDCVVCLSTSVASGKITIQQISDPFLNVMKKTRVGVTLSCKTLFNTLLHV